MTIINNSQNFNPNALNVPGLYTVVKRPPGYIVGTPTSVGFVAGTASWGPVNVPVLCGSPGDFAYKFSPVGPAALSDPFDLATEIVIAFDQTEQEANGSEYWCLRIADGTEVAAYKTLNDTTAVTPKAGIKLTALYPGIRGNDIKVTVSAGFKTGTFNVQIQAPAGLDSERYTNIPGGSAGVFWNALASAINNGQNGQRGKSQLVKASNVDATAIDPALATVTLTGGTDGRAVDAADFLGSPTSDPPTGIYTIVGLDPFPSTFWLAGLTDNSAFADIQALIDSVGTFGGLPFPAGTSMASAVTTKKSLGIDTPNIAFLKDWVYWYDSANGVQRLVSPAPFIMGRITALSPENSPLNKNVFGVVGTERLNDSTGFRRYAPADIGQAQDNGIMLIHNPIPAGPSWGLPHGSNCSTDAVRHYVEYARMTNWLAHSFEKYMGKYVGQLQGTDPDDPLRAQVKLSIDDFLEQLKRQRQIDNYKVVCDLTNNTPASIARHYLYADVFVRYMSSVQYFILNLQGGTTVTIERSVLDEQQAAQINV